MNNINDITIIKITNYELNITNIYYYYISLLLFIFFLKKNRRIKNRFKSSKVFFLVEKIMQS
jgi:hypothetical protein